MTGFASRPWLIVPIVAVMHLIYAVGYLADSSVGNITALYAANIIFGETLPFVMGLVAAIALFPMAQPMSARGVHLCLWPQQLMLFLMAYSAIAAALNRAYPDGVERSFSFIFSDQCYAVALMIGHFVALIRNARFQ